jgi:hypothetical protein
MSLTKHILKEMQTVFNTKGYKSFSSLTQSDLYDIAKWGLENEFSFSGAWDDSGGDIENATGNVVEEFNRLLNVSFPEGLKNMPDTVTIYRMIALESLDKFDKKNLGVSWFSNPNRINDPDFKQQLEHLKTPNVFVIVGQIKQSDMDIPRTLFQRDINYMENEIVVSDDKKVKLIELKKQDEFN